ncbi:MAG: hypothetical protein JRL30_09765 [Deltaproteobacteria bacterium]|nr:hypothetical protein [Deltaproteobacteria bacterium]
MPDKPPNFMFMATGIGSVPFLDIETTCREISHLVPFIPFWPQFVQRDFVEDMSVQYSEGLPLLEVIAEERSLIISRTQPMEAELVTFYEQFFAHDTEHFAISRAYAPGLYALLKLMDEDGANCGPYIKGQTVGPVTFTAGVKDPDGKPILYNRELSEAMTRGLAIKALWQAKMLENSGKRPIIFLDEPYLSGFGSAFSPIQRHEVVDMLRMIIDYLREKTDVLIGIHCCGNTDWSMIVEAGPDIVNFDAFEYMDHFLLYEADIVRFIEGGGTIAWGIVPTANFSEGTSVEDLFYRLKAGLKRIHQWGVNLDLLARGSILTPACGMGTMTRDAAKMAMNLLSDLSKRCRECDMGSLS